MEADEMEFNKVELQRLIRDHVQKTLLSNSALNEKYSLLRSLLNNKQKQIYKLSTICQSVAECEKNVKELYSLLDWEYTTEDSCSGPILPFMFIPSKYHISEPSSCESSSPHSSKAQDEESCDDHESPIILNKEPVVVLTKLRWSEVTAALCPSPPRLDSSENETIVESEMQWEPESDSCNSSDSDFSISDFDTRPNKKRKLCENIGKYKRIKRNSRGVRNTAKAARLKISTLTAGIKSSTESNKMETSTGNATPDDDDATNNASEATALHANTTVIQSKTRTSESNKTRTSESNETSTTESNETSTSESNETSTSESNETSTTEFNETSASESNEISTMESNETSTSESNETSTSESNEISTMESNETRTSESNETSTSESNETRTSKSNKTRTSKSNETKTSKSNKTRTSKSNKTRTSKSNKTRTSKSNKTRTSKSNETKTSESNKTRTSKSNETKTSESSTSKTNPQANATNSTPQSNTQTSPKKCTVNTSTQPVPADNKITPPKLPQVEITVNMNVLARRRAMSWKPGKITEIITKGDGKVKYKVVFDEMGKSLVSSHHIALDCTPEMDNLVVSARVVVKSQDDVPNFKPGILAEVPSRKNRMRFLIFFDDHTPLYCGLPFIRAVCKPLADPLDDIPDENHRNYMRSYLDSWPYPLLSHYRVGQTVNIEYNGVQQKCEILDVDNSLIYVVLMCDKQKEWVYRGSMRLEHMVNLRKEMLVKK